MKTFSEALVQIYQEAPDKKAVTLSYNQQAEDALTYRRLIQGAAGYAKALGLAGVGSGDVVILILNHGTDLVTAFFGAVLQGAIPSIMPFLTEKLSPDQYRASLKALFEITAPAAVITYPEHLEEVQSAAANGRSAPTILTCSQVSPEEHPDFNRFPGLMRSAEDIVLLQHSSGTTGLQKGIALSHRAVFNQLENYSKSINLNPQDVIVSWLPLYHDMGLIAGFILPVLYRIPLILMSPFDWVRAPHKLLQAVSKYRGTLTWLPNFAYNFCAQKIRDRDLEGVDLTSWRAVINCSEPMFLSSHQAFLERFRSYGLRTEALATCYAMAENVFAVTQGGIKSPLKIDLVDPLSLSSSLTAKPASTAGQGIKLLSAGKPLPNAHLRILDGGGEKLPNRRIGEIAIQSDCMLTGYFNRPDLTATAFLDGWYLTGDLGYMADGELYITGRKKDLIIVGGKNIYPQDLERLAGEVPGIHPGRVVAFGVHNEDTGTEDVVIVAEVDNENAEERQALANEIRRKVTRDSAIALRFVQVVGRNWLLKTSSGKIARSANREKYLEMVSRKSKASG
jgi:fatty-acyl-CoA synthase